MSIHIKNSPAKEQKRGDANSFFSVKNKREVEFDSTAHRYLMMLQEFDSSVTSYEPFTFKVGRGGEGGEVELCPSLRVDRGGDDDDFELVILSDWLMDSKRAARSACAFIQAVGGREVRVTFFRPSEVEADILPANVELLYQSALLPVCREHFPVIKEVVEFCGDITIASLLRRVGSERAIHQLIFHGALRADLANGPIDFSTRVNASPLINSIIRGL